MLCSPTSWFQLYFTEKQHLNCLTCLVFLSLLSQIKSSFIECEHKSESVCAEALYNQTNLVQIKTEACNMEVAGN